MTEEQPAPAGAESRALEASHPGAPETHETPPGAPEAPPPQIWARLDANGNLLGWSESAIAGAPAFDHQPDCTPGLYWWDAEQGAFRSSLEPITPWDPPAAQQRFHDAAIKVREMVEAGTMAGADAVRFALRFDRQAAKLPPAHPVNQALKRIRLARVTRAAPRGDGA